MSSESCLLLKRSVCLFCWRALSFWMPLFAITRKRRGRTCTLSRSKTFFPVSQQFADEDRVRDDSTRLWMAIRLPVLSAHSDAQTVGRGWGSISTLARKHSLKLHPRRSERYSLPPCKEWAPTLSALVSLSCWDSAPAVEPHTPSHLSECEVCESQNVSVFLCS